MGAIVIDPPTCSECGAPMSHESPIFGGPDTYVCLVCGGDGPGGAGQFADGIGADEFDPESSL